VSRDNPACSLCERVVPAVTRHHLFPKSVGRRKGRRIADLPTADLCPACHRQLHVLFDNQRLATQLDTVEALRSQPEVQRFLEWVRKQPVERAIRVRR
jgi:5-methylcytosine-specific restriction endonuclease McrA